MFKISGRIDKLFSYIILCAIVFLAIRVVYTNGMDLKELLWGDIYDTGGDFFYSVICTKDADPYGTFKTLYPPLANLFYYLIYLCIPSSISSAWNLDYSNFYSLKGTFQDLRLYQHCLFIFLVYVQCTVLSFYLVIKNALLEKSDLFTISLLFTVPCLFALERGNIIVFCFALCLFFATNYQSNSRFLKNSAYLFLCIAIAIKLYPVIFTLILLKRKMYKEFFKVGVVSAFLWGAPFLMFGGIEAFYIWLDVIKGFSGGNELMRKGPFFLGFVQNVSRIVTSTAFPADILQYFSIDSFVITARYILLCAVALLLVAFYYEKKVWKEYLILVLILIFAQQSSPLYNTIFLLIPLVFFANEEVYMSKSLVWFFLFFVFILVPLPYFGNAKIGYVIRLLSILSMTIYFLGAGVYQIFCHKKLRA